MLILVAGPPGAGKSTLMRRLMRELLAQGEGADQRARGLVKYHRGTGPNDVPVAVLGSYQPGETFPGTDRLSMGVHPQAVDFVSWWRGATDRQGIVLLEGDRLCSQKFVREAAAYDEVHVVVLWPSDDVLLARWKGRATKQSDSWRRGRATKVRNLAAMEPPAGGSIRTCDTDGEAFTAIRRLVEIQAGVAPA